MPFQSRRARERPGSGTHCRISTPSGKTDNSGTFSRSEHFYHGEGRTLPPVSWIVPDDLRERASTLGGGSAGQAYVTELINAIMQSPDWNQRRSSSPGTTGVASTIM